MTDSGRTIAAFQQAADFNREDSLLAGSLLNFPDYGQVVMTGDLHGHRRNFARLQRYCDLLHFGARHVILHEIIHEEPESFASIDTSHSLLLEAAQWKCAYPDQVHFLQSNHELAQVYAHEITKNGRVVTKDFEAGVGLSYGHDADKVLESIYGFIRTFPLAGRTPNRVFLSHSLPSPKDLPSFDATIFQRRPTEEDLCDRGSAHGLVWGRYHTEAALTALRDLLDVDFFLCGHQPQETGFDVVHDRMIILASEHNHGVFLSLDLNKPVTLEGLVKAIRPFAGIA
jgi:hypothetical protein